MSIKNIVQLKWVGRFIGCKKVWVSLVLIILINSVNIHVGAHSPSLPVTISVYVFLKILSRRLAKFSSGRQIPGFFQVIQYDISENATNILTSTRGEETSLGAGHPSTSTTVKEYERDRCRLMIIEFGLRLRRT